MGKLTPINRAIRVKPIASYDVETFGDKLNTFRMGSVMRDNRVKIFWDKEEMGKYLSTKYQSRYMTFATNLQFDWNCLYILDKNWDLLFNGSRLIRASHKPTHTSHYDTLNIAPISVKKMGLSIGLPKLEMKDFAKATDAEIEEYNIRDTEITFRYMNWFQNELNKMGGELKPTLPSSGMDLWRRKYLHETINQPNWLKNQITYESYYGGRTECFYKGMIDDFYVYDINSMYPFIMLRPFPDINHLKFNKENVDEYILEYEGCAKVTIYAPPMYIPILPYKFMDRLLFPCGYLTGTWTNTELRYAMENGYKLIKVHWNLYSTDVENYFENFILDLYKKRLEYRQDDKPEEYVIKILMNSLYGKFGTKIDKRGSGLLRTIDDTTELKDLIGAMIYDDKYYIKALDRIPVYVLPLLSSYVTSQSRILLHRYISKVKNYYCDTDSLFTPSTLDCSTELGDLKLEYSVARGWIFGNKMYYLIVDNLEDPIIKCKGIPYSKLAFFYEQLFERLDRKMVLNFTKFVKMKEALRRNLIPNQILDYHKTVNLYGFDKRMWNNKKFNIYREHTDTLPYYIENGEINEDKEKYIRSEINY